MNILLYFSTLGIIGLCAVLQPLFVRNRILFIRFTVCTLWISFIICSIFWMINPHPVFSSKYGFIIDPLSSSILLLILFMSGIVHLFSLRYMEGDRHFNSFFLKLILLTGSVLGFSASDNIFLLAGFWTLNQILLSKLMVHKSEWRQAKEGGRLFLKWGLAGSLFLGLGLSILSFDAESYSIQKICSTFGQIESGRKLTAFLFILIGSFIQSGIWPFHRWLMSSLNSPTPVSAFMHAGLVNGGGVLIARFAPLIVNDEIFLMTLLVIGGISLTMGTVWKLIQSNIKKMLACSTMAQMGFMFLQCGLGLFPAAVAHIFLHGLFKGFLFLNSGSAIESKNLLEKVEKIRGYTFSLFASLIGVWAFYLGSDVSFYPLDSRVVLLFFVAVASFHISLTTLNLKGSLPIISAPVSTLLFGLFYGAWIRIFEKVLEPMGFWVPQPLSIVHIGLVVFFLTIAIGINYLSKRFQETHFWKWIYVKMLNASQSDCKTITSIRSEYQF